MKLLAITCVLALVACKPRADAPLGPADSYSIVKPLPQSEAAAALLVARVEHGDTVAQPLENLLVESFVAEMVRTAWVCKQFVRNVRVDGKSFPDDVRSASLEPLFLVLGAPRPGGKGVALSGSWFGGPVERAVPWVGVPSDLGRDAALVQTLSARLADHVTGWLGPSAERALVEGYRMAMEAVAREWRTGQGPQGTVAPLAGTTEQREVWNRVRENRFVLTEGGSLRPTAELLAEPGVAATVVYRMAQSRSLAARVGPAAFYEPIAPDRLPPGVTAPAVLGQFRNFQVKLFGAWAIAILRGRAPRSIAELVEAYGREFPAERAEAIRLFVVTTFGGTVREGGVSPRPEDTAQALAELQALTADVVAGKRPLVATP